MKIIKKITQRIFDAFFEKVPPIHTVMGSRTSAQEYAKLCKERERDLNNIKQAVLREREEIYVTDNKSKEKHS